MQNYPSLDPRAVLAVASQEGLGGGVGDNGTSFGPWQLHQGGAYPSFAPQDAAGAQAWAWSPQGINYALGQINQVAGGLKGQQAVQSIVQNFERPANPSGEIAGAEQAYGLPVTAGDQTTGGYAPMAGFGAQVMTPQQVVAGRVSTLGNQLAMQLAESARQMLTGGTPNLSDLFATAKGFQQARAALPKTPPLGGTRLAQAAGTKA